jgi:hypothetical protein
MDTMHIVAYTLIGFTVTICALLFLIDHNNKCIQILKKLEEVEKITIHLKEQLERNKEFNEKLKENK